MSSEKLVSPSFQAPPSGPLPVFFDQRRRRWSRTKRLLPIVMLLLAANVAGFVLSLVSAPLVVPKPITGIHADPGVNLVRPALESARSVRMRNRYHKVISELRQFINAHPHGTVKSGDLWRPTLKPYSIVAGFFVNWDSSALASFEKHASKLTHVIPEWLHLSADGSSFTQQDDPQRQFPQMLKLARESHVAVLPLVNNFVPETPSTPGYFDPDRAHALLSSETRRNAFVERMLQFVEDQNCQGINIDFEEVQDADTPNLVRFVRAVAQAFRREGLLVTVDVQEGQDSLQQLAAAADYLIPMLYDQHDSDGAAGPIASQDWFQAKMMDFFSQVPPSRTILGVGNYAYDWIRGKTGAQDESVGQEVVTAKESGGDIRLDPASLNSHFAYEDEDDKVHDVWMLDALSAYNEIKASRTWAPAGAALWVIGEEDRALWNFYGADLIGQTDFNPTEELAHIPGDYEVERVGEGEVLNVTSEASPGHRVLTTDQKSGLIVTEQYESFPTPWVVHADPAKLRPKELALTFDDGPDGRYTPAILDILKQHGVPGTFFIVGDNANNYPYLVKREWQEGDEIGNHTFFHPNLLSVSPQRVQYEVEANERLLEVLIGRRTRFFRAPYVVDADPETPQEVKPLVDIARMGFVTVGANIDPKDYEPGKTASQIASAVEADRDKGNIILLHDAGGERNATVAALRIIIPRLQSLGYRFVTVTDLLSSPGKEASTKDTYFPQAGEEPFSQTSDYISFMAYFWIRRTLAILFTLAIVLGLARVLVIGILASLQSRKERLDTFDPLYRPRAAVLIAAFNEERVIARTIDSVLRSDYPNLGVVVVDDGSTDGTAALVSRLFGSESRVELIRKPNGGKASALNEGLSHTDAEIIISIDADTLFLPSTASMLVRHFIDPLVGGVAGNVKVGNPVNLLTRWQSLEYITGQNFDRRAYDLLNCITVVPGAVGAWRRSVLREAGGYVSDTLAEDTDLTYRARRLGYVIRTESKAVGYTEAPENIRDFRKQRLRWTFGTLQCMWKHRRMMWDPHFGAFAWIALPSLWFYAILLPLISPVMDFMIIWSLFDRDALARTAFYYGLFFLAELIATLAALRLDGEGLGLAFWLFFQRFFYRQLMYIIVWKALLKAWTGSIQGWGKLNRTGRARMVG